MGYHTVTRNKDAKTLLSALGCLLQPIKGERRKLFRMVGHYSILFAFLKFIVLYKEESGRLNAKTLSFPLDLRLQMTKTLLLLNCGVFPTLLFFFPPLRKRPSSLRPAIAFSEMLFYLCSEGFVSCLRKEIKIQKLCFSLERLK